MCPFVVVSDLRPNLTQGRLNALFFEAAYLWLIPLAAMNEAFPCSWRAVILYDEGNPVPPRSVKDGTHPDSSLGIRTSDRRLRTVLASGPARSPQDARSLVGAF